MTGETKSSGEDRLIERLFKPLAVHPAALGLTDDAAVYAPPPGHDLVITKDALVADVHFFADDPPNLIARKALRVNLSDLAAKGAKPEGFLLALALPADTKDNWVEKFAGGLGRDIESYGCALLGGDTVHTPGPLTISITAFGTVPSGTMVKRAGAKVGDRIFVTGTIGDAALGLRLRGKGADEHLLDRYLLPQPRTALADTLRANAHAAMDVSDGLAGDLAKLCRVSSVSARIEVARIPLSRAASVVIERDAALHEVALTGGDDYEILCAVPPSAAKGFVAAAQGVSLPVTDIGEVVEGREPPIFLEPNGSKLTFSRMSFSHF